MTYTMVALEDKLLEMYPELGQHQIALKLTWDEHRNSWIIWLEKDGHSRYAFLHQTEADDCMEGNKCIYLGVLIEQYVQYLEQELGILKQE